jgi:DNA-binding NarL/FixJ family response regulator
MLEQQIRIVIVEDHPGVRLEIKKLLTTSKDIIVVGEGANGADAIQLAEIQKPDVMLLDVELPILRGDEVVRRLRGAQPAIKVLAISAYSDGLNIQRMLENGASGYITKDEAPDLLLDAVHRIYKDNDRWISPRALQNSIQPILEEQPLTQHETDILQQLLLDKSEDEMSRFLGVGKKQVMKYLQLLRIKFGVESNDALKRIAQRVLSDRKPDQ